MAVRNKQIRDAGKQAAIHNEGDATNIDQYADIVNYALAQRYRNTMHIVRNPLAFNHKHCTKETVYQWLQHPWDHEKELRNISRYLYDANGQYRRLCDYQPNMVNFAYVMVPVAKYPDDEEKRKVYAQNYWTTSQLLDNMNIKTEFRKLLITAMREGVAYGYTKTSGDAFRIMMLDADYCRTVSIDGTGCIHFEFDYTFFDKLPAQYNRDAVLESYGTEFVNGYAQFQKDHKRWRSVGEDGVCVKCNEDILAYNLPPYVAVLGALFDLEDYKRLAKAKEEVGNYNLIGFNIPSNKDGKLLMDSEVAKKFIDQATSELPDTIGVLLSPMAMQQFSFDKPAVTADSNAVSEAESQFWQESGVSELLFGSAKSSSNALSRSIIADEINIFPLVYQIERWINRRLKTSRGKFKFKIRFLNITAFNESDKFDILAKAGNTGMPVKLAMGAALGFTPFEIMAMGELENQALHVRDITYSQPLYSSATMSSNIAAGEEDEAGRPELGMAELTESGEITRETEGNIRE